MGPVARKHFRVLSLARWGDGCAVQWDNVCRNSNNNNNNIRDDGDWLAFYLRRIGHRAPSPSALDLLQEHYAEDAYRLLSCCLLCSRTSGGKAVRGAVEAFFEACPTPTSVLAADQAELRKKLLPLGLNREVVMRRFAKDFVTLPWSNPCELHGCGRFASDSWKIFCLGSRHPKDMASPSSYQKENGSKKRKNNRGKNAPLDRNLAAYCRFVERRGAYLQATAVAVGGAAGGDRDRAVLVTEGGGYSWSTGEDLFGTPLVAQKRRKKQQNKTTKKKAFSFSSAAGKAAAFGPSAFDDETNEESDQKPAPSKRTAGEGSSLLTRRARRRCKDQTTCAVGVPTERRSSKRTGKKKVVVPRDAGEVGDGESREDRPLRRSRRRACGVDAGTRKGQGVAAR